ncbi:HAMP domain-containing sensor histidine kinase [Bacillus sp. Marseille-P3661]|uniref:HAMP domain-containing sensor histidine kinase n=1 Tax=Bacillus sp. Marseille-P3661 TaxID=1936234 RepID=UPI000C81EEA9|nr:HAMP domain-containing sensor histidine kinase [Bacillus sp. Marseille-P3661]
MLKKKAERVSLLRYWTTRYLVTLCIGLLIVGIISTVWIRHSVTEKRLDIMEITAAELADRISENVGTNRSREFLPRVIEERIRFLRTEGRPLIYVSDTRGELVFGVKDSIFSRLDFNNLISNPALKNVQQIDLPNGESYFLVKKQIINNNNAIGWVFILLKEEEIRRSPDELKMLFSMLISLGILGLAVIYFLSKKLLRPITEVSKAAQKIVESDYSIEIDPTIKEKEIYELQSSFKEMATRLQNLETLRTELLAGVTHELKTPVTSISGLIQAVKDEVVTGDEAKEFLAICQRETYRLQKMVEDLLDFNTFATGKVRIRKELINVNDSIKEMVHQWQITQDDEVEVSIQLPDEKYNIVNDPLRIQQIIINLLNNAKQACQRACVIEVKLQEQNNLILIEMKDNGTGIPIEEQSFIFERFYRGNNKKNKMHGLGLGLTFSKMIAKALGGDLILKESSEKGTTFTFILPK